MTDVVKVDPDQPDREMIRRAAGVLRGGGLVAFPTETVYGLGAHALDPVAVRRIFAAKGRPANDPLIVHVASFDRLAPLVSRLPDVAAVLARSFWPGPLTLVLPRARVVPDEVTAGLDTVAVRIPAHPVALALLEEAAIPVAAPSANLFSRPSPTRARHVLEDLDGRIDLLIDGGPTTVGVESTVLDLSGVLPAILRPGAVTLDMLRPLVPGVELRSPAGGTEALPSPGLLERHYSPRAPLTLYEGPPAAVAARIEHDAGEARRAGHRVGVIAADEDRLPDALAIGSERDLPAVAARLYDAIRQLDAADVDLILVRAFPADSGLGVAIHDRLRRAAAGRVIRVGN